MREAGKDVVDSGVASYEDSTASKSKVGSDVFLDFLSAKSRSALDYYSSGRLNPRSSDFHSNDYL